MEGFPVEKLRRPEGRTENIPERVKGHSLEFDKETAKKPRFTNQEVRANWETREWKIGDTTIQAIGVSHVPETFLEFREQIEQAIQDSDIVVNEFAPEAIGIYDSTKAADLKNVKSVFNEAYDLEQLRQSYMRNERAGNIGPFHHEVELLAAKYNKDMATADLSYSRDVESLLQDSYLYAYGAEQNADQEASLKKAGLFAGASLLGIAGAANLVKESEKPMSRRKFLNIGLVAGAATLMGLTPKITETPPKTAEKKSVEMTEKSPDEWLLSNLRDAKLADALQKLARAGYKRIAFIYGASHLNNLERYINNPAKFKEELIANQNLINQNNPDSFRVYRLSDGTNHSEKFTASPHKIWKRIAVVE